MESKNISSQNDNVKNIQTTTTVTKAPKKAGNNLIKVLISLQILLVVIVVGAFVAIAMIFSGPMSFLKTEYDRQQLLEDAAQYENNQGQGAVDPLTGKPLLDRRATCENIDYETGAPRNEDRNLDSAKTEEEEHPTGLPAKLGDFSVDVIQGSVHPATMDGYYVRNPREFYYSMPEADSYGTASPDKYDYSKTYPVVQDNLNLIHTGDSVVDLKLTFTNISKCTISLASNAFMSYFFQVYPDGTSSDYYIDVIEPLVSFDHNGDPQIDQYAPGQKYTMDVQVRYEAARKFRMYLQYWPTNSYGELFYNGSVYSEAAERISVVYTLK